MRPVIWGFAGNSDHGYIGHIGEVPYNMADNSRYDYDSYGERAVTDLQELECIEERHHPWQKDQPGTVAAPFLRFYAV